MMICGMQRQSAALGCLSFLFLLGTSMGWSPNASPPQAGSMISRRSLLDGLVVGAIGLGGSILLPGSAHADVDVTSKIAAATSIIGGPAALRNVKRAQKGLGGLLPLAEANDFLEVKSFLRTPPFAEVRRNAFILVRGAEDGPNAVELQATYTLFIASMEKIDGTASLGARGRNIPELQMSGEYRVIESSMKDFLKVAEEAVAIPAMQYNAAGED
jgi:hypothetical protein